MSLSNHIKNNSILGVTPSKFADLSTGLPKREALRLFAAYAQVGTANGIFYTGGPVNGGYVDSITTEIPTDADGFFVILANGSTSQTLTVSGINYRVSGDWSARPYNAVTPVAGTFDNGQAGKTIPVASSSQKATFVRSDTTSLTTVARTDTPSETKRILHVRVAYSAIGGDTTGTTPLSYWSRGGSGTRWTTASPTGFKTSTWLQAGDLSTNISTSSNNSGGSTIFGIGYISRGKVRTIAFSGDSYVAGYEEGDEGRSFLIEGAIATASITGIPTEYMNLGRGGNTAIQYTDRALAVLSLFKPTDFVQHGYSPNNGPSVTAIDNLRQQLLRAATYCENNGIKFWVTTGSPNTNAGNTASNYDAPSQARELSYNTEIANYGRMIDIASKTQAGSGLWPAGASVDGVHVQESWSTINLVPFVASKLSSY